MITKVLGYLTLFNTATNVAVSALVGVYISRGLDVSERGDVYFYFQLAVVLSVFCTLGMGQAIIYTVKNKLIEPSKAFSLSIACLICLFTFFSLALAYIFLYKQHDSIFGISQRELLILYFSVFFMSIHTLINSFIQIESEGIKQSLLYSATGNLFYLTIFTLLFFVGGMTVELCLLVFLFAWLFRLLVCALLIARKRMFSNFSFTDIKVFFRGSFSFYINIVVFSLYAKFVFFVSAYFLSDYDVGLFSLASTIADLVIIIPSAIGTVLFPYITGNNSIDKSKFIASSSKVMFEVSFFSSVFMLIFGSTIISIFYGDSYIDAFELLLYMLPGAVFLSLTFAFGNYLNSIGLTNLCSKFYIVCVCISLFLTSVLTYQCGALGAAISYSIANFILFILFVCKVSKLLETEVREFIYTGVSKLILINYVTNNIFRIKGNKD